MVHVYSLAIFPAVVARRTHIVGWPADVTETYFGGSGCWPSNPSVFCRQKAVFGGKFQFSPFPHHSRQDLTRVQEGYLRKSTPSHLSILPT